MVSEGKDRKITPAATQLATRSALHPAVEAILKKDPTPETLDKLLALQREFEKDTAKRAYTEALVGLKADLPAFVKRDKKVDFTGQKGRVQYTHASLAAVMQAVQPALTAHGFSVSAPASNNEKGVTVTARLTHHAGHSEETSLSAPPDMSGSKSIAQGIASTITLLQRYAILALLGIATADMGEPAGGSPPPADQVDPERNLKAMRHFIQLGKSKIAVEEFVGKPVAEWTAADLERLRTWGEPAARTSA